MDVMRKFITHADRIVPMRHPWVLVETVKARGVSAEAVLAGTELEPEIFASPEARISYDEYGVMIRNALRLTGDSGLGIQVGKNLGTAHMGVFGLALMNSATVGKALDLWLQYAPLLAPSWGFSLSIEPPRAFLLVREWIPRRPVEVYATELLLSAFDTVGRQLFDGPLPVRRMHLAYARPPHAERYREFYDIPTSFNQGMTAIEFDASLLEAAIPCADPATSKLANWYCAEQLSLDATPEGLVARVRLLLASAVQSPPDVEQLARTLQISTRTLRRTLQQMSTSYRQLLEESRRRRASQRPRSAPLSVEAIAAHLGFRDVQSFRRAFKSRTGQPASAHSERRGEGTET
jgi:AraC-like DNA-binding protein